MDADSDFTRYLERIKSRGFVAYPFRKWQIYPAKNGLDVTASFVGSLSLETSTSTVEQNDSYGFVFNSILVFKISGTHRSLQI